MMFYDIQAQEKALSRWWFHIATFTTKEARDQAFQDLLHSSRPGIKYRKKNRPSMYWEQRKDKS